MENKPVFIFCLLGVLFQAALCGGMGTNTNMADQKIMTITKEDNGKKISVKTGDELRIELKELGSAGYGWYVDNINKEYLELISKETRAISGGGVGAPVVAVWLFKARKKGSSEIKMDQYRAWEGKEKATEHFSIQIVIE
jgi:predicted secreted protein